MQIEEKSIFFATFRNKGFHTNDEWPLGNPLYIPTAKDI
jgi:hypothetical protein